jgi:hypothetical protein
MFREIHEIKESEKLYRDKKKEDGYKKIKPETDIGIEEANAFIVSLFQQVSKES